MKERINFDINKLNTGIEKLKETRVIVDDLQDKLQKMAPDLEI